VNLRQGITICMARGCGVNLDGITYWLWAGGVRCTQIWFIRLACGVGWRFGSLLIMIFNNNDLVPLVVF